METICALSIEDRLREILFEKNPIFNFYTPENVDKLQYRFEVYQKNGITATMETLGAKDDKLNEDSFVHYIFRNGKYFFGVLDGASSQKPISGLERYGIKGSAYISHLLSLGFFEKDFEDLYQRHPNFTAGEIMRFMNEWLNKRMSKLEGVDYSDVLSIPGMAASFVTFDLVKQNATLAHVADTVTALVYQDDVRIISHDQNCKFDEETIKFRQELCIKYNCTLVEMEFIPEAKAECRNELQKSYRKKINQPNGCGILNGMPELVDNNLIYETTFDLDGLQEIFIASDGALLPYGGRYSTDIDSVKNFISTNNFTNPSLQYGAALLEKDRDRVAISRIKHRDDATVIRIRL